jgi:hypothetical protein
MEWWQTSLCVIGGLVALPYVLGPIVVWMTVKTQANPVFEQIRTQEELPPAVSEIFESSISSLTPIGFQATDFLYQKGMSTHVTTYLAVFRNQIAEEVAMAVAMFAEVKTPTGSESTIQTQYVEFSTEYEDGTMLDTSTNLQCGPFKVPANKHILRVMVSDAAEVFGIHQALQKHLATGKRKRVPPADSVALLLQGIRKEMEQAVADGYQYYNAAADSYCPTLTGAWIMTWKLLPPFSSIRQAADRRRCDALLQKLDLRSNSVTFK